MENRCVGPSKQLVAVRRAQPDSRVFVLWPMFMDIIEGREVFNIGMGMWQATKAMDMLMCVWNSLFFCHYLAVYHSINLGRCLRDEIHVMGYKYI